MDLNGTPLEQADIATISAELRTGQVKAREVVDTFLNRIEALDQTGPELNAVITINAAALDRADELDRVLADTGEPVGPLHGIPLVVKDCLDTSDMPTSFGSEIFADYVPRADATVIAKLRDAGAIIIAKDHPAGLGHVVVQLFLAQWRHQEPLRPRTRPWRLEQRNRSRRGSWLRRGGTRHRLRRLRAPAVLVLQPGRSALYARNHQPERL